ncbi:hypothetical protein FNF31_00315 [Cafeteria roenbergensis]|uniref:Trehalase n=2 Tax=Cafeteria roenbergensis TaxID=33653 RepID=A0A5A8DM23_CAFRO|nr:hypothetical protein FNF28_03126 [Cafeteria roenbergensis]KAA0168433.1 hypothetical protein FNF31_00315 [Cafeteria roenbergensis]
MSFSGRSRGTSTTSHMGDKLIVEDEGHEPQDGMSWLSSPRSRMFVAFGVCMAMSAVVTTIVLILLPKHAPGPYWEQICTVMCSGPLIAAVNDLGFFNDSKTFVDMPLIEENPKNILDAFTSVDAQAPEAVWAFLAKHFGPAGSDLLTIEPPDWTATPKVATSQTNVTLRSFASGVNAIWRDLTRQVAPDVVAAPQRHTLLPLPRHFVVAGGRFRELYFWDSYWIVLGLLRSGMTETATAMVENLAWTARLLGKVPNGARAYYVNRSQPPLLALMADAVVAETGNATLAAYVLPAVQAEMRWYGILSGGSGAQEVTVGKEKLYRYNVAVSGPRPESWREDMATAKQAGAPPGSQAALSLWGNIASAAESGWDFSSRWLGAGGRDMTTARTSSIVPADLNSIVVMQLRAAARLERVGGAAGSGTTASQYEARATQLCSSINAALWNESLAWWADFDLEAGALKPATAVTPAAFFPLWAGCAGSDVNGTVPDMAYRAANALVHTSGLWQEGGVVTSNLVTGQQWDSPAAWPPLQWILVQALLRAEAKTDAKELARRWLRSNMLGFQRTGTMFEKYDAFNPGHISGGGEYTPQRGFGWTNGVVLDLLSQFDFATLG